MGFGMTTTIASSTEFKPMLLRPCAGLFCTGQFEPLTRAFAGRPLATNNLVINDKEQPR
jgi:hypothetical protein